MEEVLGAANKVYLPLELGRGGPADDVRNGGEDDFRVPIDIRPRGVHYNPLVS